MLGVYFMVESTLLQVAHDANFFLNRSFKKQNKNKNNNLKYVNMFSIWEDGYTNNYLLYHVSSSFLLSTTVQYFMIPREEVELDDATSYNIFDTLTKTAKLKKKQFD